MKIKLAPTNSVRQMTSMLKGAFCLASATAILGWVSPSQAQIQVDTELSLLIDGSGSISSSDFTNQLSAYANVFNNPDFFNDFSQSSLSQGGTGQFAVNLIQFSSGATEELPFALIDSVAASQAFASQISSISQSVGVTNLAAGINLATSTLLTNEFEGTTSMAIDISTDGFPSSPIAAANAAANALNSGVDVINAIAVGSGANVAFLENQIIGGTNASGEDAFVLAVGSFGDEFQDAIEEKIVGELAPPPKITPEPASTLGFALVGAGGAIAAWKRKRLSSSML
ncbi:MAG: DUF1194 domain-containing protein [Cyanobacteriota bacterium]|nr:DUF1194 domain-containing protein [Cyanobacteriota bacterium]